jgi:hypothetical protein
VTTLGERFARDYQRMEQNRAQGLDVYGQPLPTGKRCTKCGDDQPFDEYPPNKKTKDGLSSWCRDCHREASRQWRKSRNSL